MSDIPRLRAVPPRAGFRMWNECERCGYRCDARGSGDCPLCARDAEREEMEELRAEIGALIGRLEQFGTATKPQPRPQRKRNQVAPTA